MTAAAVPLIVMGALLLILGVHRSRRDPEHGPPARSLGLFLTSIPIVGPRRTVFLIGLVPFPMIGRLLADASTLVLVLGGYGLLWHVGLHAVDTEEDRAAPASFGAIVGWAAVGLALLAAGIGMSVTRWP